MATFYARIRDNTVYPLLKKYGAEAYLVVGSDTFDPQTGVVVSNPDTNKKCRALITEYKDSETDGTNIRKTDSLIYLDAKELKVVPTTSHRLKIGSDNYEIVSISSIKPGGVVVMWKLQARN